MQMSDENVSNAPIDSPVELPTQYSILRRVASGGMGVVYKAIDNLLQREVALKLLLRAEKTEESQERFRRETRVLSSLDHPNIVKLYAADFDNSQNPFLVMEWVEGQTLQSLVESGNFDTPLLKTTMEQLFSAVDYAHAKGIIHRDITPSNLMLFKNDNGKMQIKLLDFGLARSANSPNVRLTSTGQVLGNPSFMSPEQCKGELASFASDIYSVGSVLFFCLLGRTPFSANNPMELMYKHVNEAPDFSSLPVIWKKAGIISVLEKAMEKEPSKRFKSIDEFQASFNRVIARVIGASSILGKIRLNLSFLFNSRLSLYGSIAVIALILVFSFGRDLLTHFEPYETRKLSSTLASEADRVNSNAMRDIASTGLNAKKQAELEQAAKLYESAISAAQGELREGKIVNESRLYSTLVHCAYFNGGTYYYLQKYDLSEKYYRLALDYVGKTPNPDVERITVLKFYCIMLTRSHLRAKYINLLVEMPKWNTSDNPSVKKFYADAKVALAKQYSFDSKIIESNQVLRGALAAYEGMGLGTRPNEALANSLMAENYYELKEIGKAKRFLSASEKLISSDFGEDEDIAATAAVIAARLEGIFGNRDRAEKLFEIAMQLAMRIASDNGDFATVAMVLEKYGSFELGLGEFQKAEAMARKKAAEAPQVETLDLVHPVCNELLAESDFMQGNDLDCQKNINLGRPLAVKAKALGFLQAKIFDLIEARLCYRKFVRGEDRENNLRKSLISFESSVGLLAVPKNLQDKFVSAGFDDYVKLLEEMKMRQKASSIRNVLLRIRRTSG